MCLRQVHRESRGACKAQQLSLFCDFQKPASAQIIWFRSLAPSAS
jgi:hypothetical protein